MSARLKHVLAAEGVMHAPAGLPATARPEPSAGDGRVASLTAIRLAVEGLVDIALERPVEDRVVAAIAATAGEETKTDGSVLRLELCRWAVGHPRLLSHPPQRAVEAQLRLAAAGPPLAEVSLWRQGDGGPEWIASVGADEPTKAVRREARRLLSRLGTSDAGPVLGAAVMRWQELKAVVVGRAGRRVMADRCRSMLEATAVAVQPALEKDELLTRNSERERLLLESTERRLTRVGLDLHDGPIQDVAVLAEDIRYFRNQLETALDGREDKHLLAGRTQDLEARLQALDQDLREVARSFDSPIVLRQPLAEAIRTEVESFGKRADVDVVLDISGDADRLTASQRIAVIRIVQESLANVREHSDASRVEISVVASGGAVEATIRDNGRGFDVERALVRAARRGRLGLVGMSERVRLLGGTFDVQSSPGGPTTVSVALPEWQPLAAGDVEGLQKRRA